MLVRFEIQEQTARKMKKFFQSGAARKCLCSCRRVYSVRFHLSWHRLSSVQREEACWIGWVKKKPPEHICIWKWFFFCSSAVFNLAFPLALCVFFNTQYVSALKKKNSHNQESINRHNAVRIKSRGSLTFSLEYQFISKLFSALHLLQCFVTVHCQFQTTPMIWPQTEMNEVLIRWGRR